LVAVACFLPGRAEDLSAPPRRMGAGSFPGVKWPGHGINYPHLFSVEVLSSHIIGWTLPFIR